MLTFLRSDRRVETLVVLTAILSVFGFPFLVMMPVFARDVLHVNAAGYGALTAAVGAGRDARRAGDRGELAAHRPPRPPDDAGRDGLRVCACWRSPCRAASPLSLVLLALAGCAMIVNNALTNTLLQTLVPDDCADA